MQATIDFKQHEGLLKLELDTGIGTLRSVTGYQHSHSDTIFDSDGRYSSAERQPPRPIPTRRIFENTFQENLDFTITAIDRLDLIIGFTYFHNTIDLRSRATTTRLAFPNACRRHAWHAAHRLPEELLTMAMPHQGLLAGFFDATFQATDRLTFNVGGRYSAEKQNIPPFRQHFCTTRSQAALCRGVTVPLGGLNAYVYDASASFQIQQVHPARLDPL